MFRLIKKLLILVLVSAANSLKCISLRNQECKVRKVIADKKYMAFPNKIEIGRCTGSFNNISNPHSRVCVSDIVKNITVKMLDLMTLTNKTKQVIFHESYKCVCKINSKVCSQKQKFNENKCRCECLVNKKCQNDFL